MSELNLIGGNLRYNKEQKYLIFDMESCHLSLMTDNLPWQVGFIIATGSEILKECNLYLKWPNLNISADAARITHFDPKIIEEKGIDPLKALKFFDSYLYNPEYRVAGFNILNFDVYVHNIWRRELGFETDYSYLDKCIDVRSLILANKLGLQINSSDNLYFFQKKLLNYVKRGLKSNLTLSCKELGIKIDENLMHDALQDVKATRLVMLELFKKISIK